jgi:hypothetical protein
MKAGHEEMNVQVDSLASRIDANLKEMEAWLETT